MAEPTIDQAFPDDVRERVALRFWQDGGELSLLGRSIDVFYDRLQERLKALFRSASALDCPEPMLELLAYQRDIERLQGEPLELFRRRVHFAFANARDAGSPAGFARIWQRLGLGAIAQEERVDPVDWDVIVLTLDEEIFAAMVDTYLDALIAQYGRTCRRYRYKSVAKLPPAFRPFDFYGDYYSTTAVL